MTQKQSQSPRSESTNRVDRLGHLISLLERILRKELSDALAPMQLTLQQYAALQILNNNDKMSNAKLAKRSFMTPQSTNEMVNTMEAKSLIVRQPNENHGRIIHILISRKGKKTLQKADAAVLEVEKRMLEHIPQNHRIKFRDQLIGCIIALKASVLQDFPLNENLDT